MENHLQTLEKNHLLRKIITYTKKRNEITTGAKRYLNFSSNDYLCLSENPHVLRRAEQFLRRHGAGATASRLLCGNMPAYDLAEKKLAEFKGTPASLIYPTGYAANIGILTALADAHTTIFMDRLSHASIVDGVLLAKSRWVRFRHNDLHHLETLLKKHRHRRQKIIVTEAVFSMDGDLAPLLEINSLAERYECLLYVDEAHATGLFGDNLSGLAGAVGLSGMKHVLLMGTFGKALGSFGAYFAGTASIRESLVNRSRPFIYSTGLPPAVLGAICGALDYLRSHPHLGKKVLAKADYLRRRLEEKKIETIPGASQIVSVLAPSSEMALAMSAYMKSRGMLIVAIRPPTVPPHSSRLRIAVNLGHTRKQIDRLVDHLADWRQR